MYLALGDAGLDDLVRDFVDATEDNHCPGGLRSVINVKLDGCHIRIYNLV